VATRSAEYPFEEKEEMERMKTVTRLSTGIAGLDEILCGGVLPQNSYLVRGGPGAG
jgi:circadian clock protein KaiC